MELNNMLALGGGKMVGMTTSAGFLLMHRAYQLGLRIVDTHHRYGNSEHIISEYNFDHYPYLVSAKISAYASNYQQLIRQMANSVSLLYRDIFVYWVSDLDNETLYSSGCNIYKNIYKDFNRVGITSENPKLVMRFADEHPECDYFMIPLFIGRDDMVTVCKTLRDKGKNVFVIKPFDDGRLFENYSVEDCLRFVKKANPSVTVFGTKQIKHLEEVVKIWNSI